MDVLGEWLELLSWPTEAVNAIRVLLSNLNVPLPAWLAQLLAFLILVLIAFYLFLLTRRAFATGQTLRTLAQGVAGLAAVVAAVAIAFAWLDALVTPPKRQIAGTVEGASLEELRIDLLDYRGEYLAAHVVIDLSAGKFLVTYEPEFADPPSAIVATAPGCKEARVALRRTHLKSGAPLAIRLDCPGDV